MGLIPGWWAGYGGGDFRQDVVAGLVVVVMLVPQSMAYALLAGVPIATGLYASILPLLGYALFGSSRTLAVGPAAVVALMTAAALTPLANPGSAEYTRLAGMLALLSGALLFAGGWMRLGFVANLLSHSVISGFMSGAALLIVIGQLRPLLGMAGEGHTALAFALSLAANLETISPVTSALGVVALLLLWFARRFLSQALQRLGVSQRLASILGKLAPMLIVVLATVVVSVLDLDARHGVKVVGAVPRGVPPVEWIVPSAVELSALLVPALAVSLIGFVESVSVAQALARQRQERIEPNAELRALGAANLAAAVSGGMPVTGGLSRSVVNFEAGARSPLAGVVSAVLMGWLLLGPIDCFARLPTAVLAATIIVAAIGLIDLPTLRHAWRYERFEAFALLSTALGTLLSGVATGILIGVSLSISMVFWRASRPHIAVLGRVPGTHQYRNVKRARVVTWPHILALRVDENLFFANMRATEDALQQALTAQPSARHVILDLSAVNFIDFTALERLTELQSSLAERGITLHLAEVKGPVLDRLEGTDLRHALRDRIYRFTHDAFVALEAAATPVGPSSP